MPWVSAAQRRWGNSSAGHRALGDAGVAEWNAASKGEHNLPEHSHMAGYEKKKVDLGEKGSFEVKHGALHRMLNIPMSEKIPESRLESAEHSDNPLEAKRARSAMGFRAMQH